MVNFEPGENLRKMIFQSQTLVTKKVIGSTPIRSTLIVYSKPPASLTEKSCFYYYCSTV